MFKNLPLKDVLELFRYSDGDLYWRVPKQGRKIHSPIRCRNSRGYVTVVINGRHWSAHRFVWNIHHGEIPDDLEVDHKNRTKHDNRIANLRLLTRSKNLHNVPAKRGNKGGCVGVNWVKRGGYWQATICVNYKQKYLGSSANYFEACCLRKSEEANIYKEMGL